MITHSVELIVTIAISSNLIDVFIGLFFIYCCVGVM